MGPQDSATLFDQGDSSSSHSKGGSNHSDRRGFANDFSKTNIHKEAWVVRTAQSRRSMNKTNLLPTASKKEPSAAESGAIIDQALSVVLNVVSAISESTVGVGGGGGGVCSEVPIIRKIAKKRRKENDEDDALSTSIHHTTSCKEYLRKVQESLRRTGREESTSSDTESSNEDQPVPSNGDNGNQTLPYAQKNLNPQTQANNHSAKDHSGGNGKNGGANAATATGDVYGYGGAAPDSDKYGYENPDKVMPSTRTKPMYRRRGSVTKFSFPAQAAAAAAVTNRIMRLGLSTALPGRNHPMRRSPGVQPGIKAHGETHTSSTSEATSWFRQNENQSSKKDAMTSSNPYGYEDHQPWSSFNVQQQQPPRRRAQRRGSVTKFSLEAAQVVKASDGPTSSQVEGSQPTVSLDQHLRRTDAEPSSQASIQHPPPAAVISTSGFLPAIDVHTSPNVMQMQGPKSASYRGKNDCIPPSNDPCFSDSDESNDIDSVASFDVDLKDDAAVGDFPVRPPRRIASMESAASSLAPDLRSFCSISRSDDVPSPPPPRTINY